jgi:hypothetical protein
MSGTFSGIDHKPASIGSREDIQLSLGDMVDLRPIEVAIRQLSAAIERAEVPQPVVTVPVPSVTMPEINFQPQVSVTPQPPTVQVNVPEQAPPPAPTVNVVLPVSALLFVCIVHMLLSLGLIVYFNVR